GRKGRGRRSEPGPGGAGPTRRGGDRRADRGRDPERDGPSYSGSPLTRAGPAERGRRRRSVTHRRRAPRRAPGRVPLTGIRRASTEPEGPRRPGRPGVHLATLAHGLFAVAAGPIQTVPGMPPVIDPTNLYGETAGGKLAPAVANALPRVYVPNLKSNDVYVIDPTTRQVVDRFKVGTNP